jgi:DNA-binding transcriptional regulator YhcF (GntR family)
VITSSSNASTQDRTDLLNHEVERLVVEADQLGLNEDQVVAAVRKHWRKLSPKS